MKRTPLQQAKYLEAKFSVWKATYKRSKQDRRDRRDIFGDTVGLSGRDISRYMAVLRTPLSVQRAFDRCDITLKTAESVAHQAPEIQRTIDVLIRRGLLGSALKLLPKKFRRPTVKKLVARNDD